MFAGQEITIKALSGGINYLLNDVFEGWTLVTYDGLGIAEINRLFDRGPSQDGDTDLGFRRQPRYVTLGFVNQGCRGRDLWSIRQEMLGIFRPRVDDPVQLIITLPTGQRRALDVNLEGELDYATNNRKDGRTQSVQMVLKASDPRLYDPEQHIESAFLRDVTFGWEIEETGQTTQDGWMIEETGETTGDGWNIGPGNFEQTITINYGSNSPLSDIEYPIITLIGPIINPIITNLSTQEVLDFSNNGGMVLSTGDTVIIDTRYGYKTVTDAMGNRLDFYLTDDSDLATFHLSYNTELLPDGTRSDGTNIIRITGDGTTGDTLVRVAYYDRYAGM